MVVAVNSSIFGEKKATKTTTKIDSSNNSSTEKPSIYGAFILNTTKTTTKLLY